MPDPKPYTTGTWNGLTNYQCRWCPYATLEEVDLVGHALARHGLEMAKMEAETTGMPLMRPVRGLILGPDGKPITHIPMEKE